MSKLIVKSLKLIAVILITAAVKVTLFEYLGIELVAPSVLLQVVGTTLSIAQGYIVVAAMVKLLGS